MSVLKKVYQRALAANAPSGLLSLSVGVCLLARVCLQNACICPNVWIRLESPLQMLLFPPDVGAQKKLVRRLHRRTRRPAFVRSVRACVCSIMFICGYAYICPNIWVGLESPLQMLMYPPDVGAQKIMLEGSSVERTICHLAFFRAVGVQKSSMFVDVRRTALRA